MALVLDTGALIAVERGERTVAAFLERAQVEHVAVRTSAAAVAQAWRAGAREGRLARLLQAVDEGSLDSSAARRVGALLMLSATVDVVDAAVIDSAMPGDEILTSDPGDLAVLAEAAGKRLTITPVST